MNNYQIEVTTALLYDAILGGRKAPHTDRCAPGDGWAAPVANDPVTSQYMLRILKARWNKTYLDDVPCEDQTLITQNVMNPRTRLWGAATAYLINKERVNLQIDLANTISATYDDQTNCMVLPNENGVHHIYFFTNDGTGNMNPPNINPGDQRYQITVNFYKGTTRQQRAQPITNFHNNNSEITANVTLTPR